MSVINKAKPDSSNRGFLRALFAAIVFMLISSVILVVGFLAWHYPQLAAGTKIKPITLTGKDFYIAIGKGDHEGGKLRLLELDEAKSAVISSKRAKFNASQYPVVEYKVTGRTPGATVVLYWRTVTHNHKTLFAKLHWNGDYLSAYNMGNEPEWKGAVTELGVSVSGDLRDQPITIEQITFSPLTVKSLLLLVWTEWNAFEGWSQKSINAIKGMPENALISPVVVAAAWCGLAMALYSLWLFFYRTPKVRFELEMEDVRRPVRHAEVNGDAPGEGQHPIAPKPNSLHSSKGRNSDLQAPDSRHSGAGRNPQPSTNKKPQNTRLSITRQIWDFKTIVTMFMIAWFALDGKWQVNLWRQLADTKYLFAGKSHHEQHLAAEDAAIYIYAKRLREKVLPEKPVRIFVFSESHRSFWRVRLMYYLSPHNVYNFGKYSSSRWLSKYFTPGDYVIMLQPSPIPVFDEKSGILHWGPKQRFYAHHVDHDRFGDTFVINKTN